MRVGNLPANSKNTLAFFIKLLCLLFKFEVILFTLISGIEHILIVTSKGKRPKKIIFIRGGCTCKKFVKRLFQLQG